MLACARVALNFVERERDRRRSGLAVYSFFFFWKRGERGFFFNLLIYRPHQTLPKFVLAID